MSSSDPQKGAAYIKAFASRLGTQPGVYRMIDAAGKVLYVGKARNLKNRVSSYATRGSHSNRIMAMIAQTAEMEVITTRSEAEALLLEASLIKQLGPVYNILLKDDKSYPYIRVTTGHDFPRIEKHRGKQKKGELYFGPFASVGAVNQTLAVLQKAFLLRPCSDSIFKHRTRPCLQYQIKRCSAPCVDYIGKEDYAALVAEAAEFLSGKSRAVQEELLTRMQQASEAQDYEKAAMFRDRIRALTQVQQEQGIATGGLTDADVIAVHVQEGRACVEVFFYRGGQPFGNRAYFPQVGAEQSAAEILSAFIGQFYQNQTPPRELYVSEKMEDRLLLEEAFALYADHTVSITQPQRGDKKKLIEQVRANAENALNMRIAERTHEQKHLKAVGKLFGLSEPPSRIEVYDNSHISGTHAVGGMVVAGPEGFEKNQYRRFTIRRQELAPGDDYGMLREVMTRRLTRLQKEDPDRTQGNWPDLMLIDGGKGQLSAVLEVFEELGIADLPVVCIAKGPDRNAGREQFFMPGKQSFQMPVNDPTLHYLQRLRDEVHRFAITSHRIKRANALRASELDQIEGIGATRKKALLHHFGSSKAVGSATLEELENVSGINKKVARIIYDYFHA